MQDVSSEIGVGSSYTRRPYRRWEVSIQTQLRGDIAFRSTSLHQIVTKWEFTKWAILDILAQSKGKIGNNPLKKVWKFLLRKNEQWTMESRDEDATWVGRCFFIESISVPTSLFHTSGWFQSCLSVLISAVKQYTLLLPNQISKWHGKMLLTCRSNYWWLVIAVSGKRVFFYAMPTIPSRQHLLPLSE